MAVEIKELVIRAVADKAPTKENNAIAADLALTQENLEQVVEACVREVLRILERKEAR